MEQTASAELRRRLALLVALHGYSYRAFEQQLGRGNGWLGRKLRGTKPLKATDLDAILAQLDEPPSVLLGAFNHQTDTTQNEDQQ